MSTESGQITDLAGKIVEYCGGKENEGTVFITDYGNRYHTSLNCGELKRTVRSVTLPEAEEAGLRACKKCGNEDERGLG